MKLMQKSQSTIRTPADQARIMFDAIESEGVAYSMGLYGPAGDKVTDVYVAGKLAGKSDREIKIDMESKINAVGPTKVSNHIKDPVKINVVDIAPSSIQNKPEFIKAVNEAMKSGSVSKFLQPPIDKAYHLEIPQPVTPLPTSSSPTKSTSCP